MRKEENARKVLSMEEALMTKVVQDTKEFEQEEKANSKVSGSIRVFRFWCLFASFDGHISFSLIWMGGAVEGVPY